jgi:hypothetical protein
MSLRRLIPRQAKGRPYICGAMHKLLSTLLTLAISYCSFCQTNRHLKVSFLDSSRLGPTAEMPLLGGVSAMDWIPETFLKPSSKTSSSLFLFTDHTPNKPEQGVNRRTLVFEFDVKSKQLKKECFPFDSTARSTINSVEAVRYSSALNAIFYSYESENTGIVRLNKNKKADTILSLDIPVHRDNRGIEAMCIAPDNSLWFCLESGKDDNSGYIAFDRIPYDPKAKKHNTKRDSVYRYPFDKCSCLRDSLCARFNATLGNGITEMISLPKELGDGFLVLERCFDGTAAQVRLFLATIDTQNLMHKTLVFDFNEALLKPDNLEGMAWGPKENGRYVLYVVSDDNYNPRYQRTQLIRLAVGR